MMVGVTVEESAAAQPPIVGKELRGDGVCILTIDDRAATHNTITPQLGAELASALDQAEADSRVRAIVLRSGKKESFLVGANIDYLVSIRFASDAEEISLEASKRFARIARSRKPVVACVHGPALGGGFELALACSATIATDDEKTVLGLPEVKLGLMPAANGLLRVAERAGLQVAIDLGLSGRSLRPATASTLGLVDEIVAAPVALEAACRFALRLAIHPDLRRALPKRRAHMRHRGSAIARLRDVPRVLLENNPAGRALLFRHARAEATQLAQGHYPATARMLDVLARYGARGFDKAARLEAQLFGELVVSETSHRLIELFFARAETKKDTGLEIDERDRAQPFHVARVAVVGAGRMGAGIACVTVQAGLPTAMNDTSDAALRRAREYVSDVLDERVRRGAISAVERARTYSLLSGARDEAGIAAADLVIEAVFEDLELKRAILRDLEGRVKDTCVIASSTSSCTIAKIAEGSLRPDRIVGMHYFSPDHRGPLLEVVRAKHTDPRAVATAVAVGKKQGKTVIVIRDGTGFYTTRILTPYLNEAVQMLTEGVSVEIIDRALVDWGFPTGPLRLLDEMGIDSATDIALALQDTFGERLRVPDALAALRRDDRRGKKNGRGFYLHGRGQQGQHEPERLVDDTVYRGLRIRTLQARQLSDEINLRCTIGVVNEALRCLEEGILRSARDGDIGAVYGIGFPAFRGGPFRYVDVLGAPEILRRTRHLEQRFGARFAPAPLLVEMARKGRRFYG